MDKINPEKSAELRHFSHIALICSAIVAILGILVMIGWMMGTRNLSSLGSSSIPQAPVSSLAFILLGGTWFFYIRSPSRNLLHMSVLVCAFFIFLLALLNLIHFLTGINTGIEEFLMFRIFGIDPSIYGADPMSPITATSFLLTCTAMILLLIPVRRVAGLYGGFASVVTSVNLVILLGYLYSTPLLYGGEIRPVSLPSGVTFLFLSIALIATSGPDHFPLRSLVGPSVRALLLRAFFLVIFVFILIDIILYNLLIQLNISEALKTALSVLISVGIASIVISQISRILGGAMDRAEAERKQIEEALRKAHDELDIRVQERTVELTKANKALHAEIIERKRAEEKIREQAALLDKAHDTIAVLDLEHHIIYCNKSAEHLYGWTAEEIIGKNADELVYKEVPPQLIEAKKSVIESGEWSGELNQVTRDGKEIIVESRWTLMHDSKGDAKSILIINTDITEKKKFEAQFLRAQRMESIGTLASGIAHDINNVLSPIMLSLELLKKKFTDNESQELVNILERSAKRGASLIKQVQSFARGIEGERVTLQVAHLISEIKQIAKETFPRSIEIRTDIPKDLWTISGDATQLHQVLMNLCVNARDAMSDGGTLSISAENLYIDKNYARMNVEAKVGSYIVITIADTGIGIPPETIDRIFEPFFTTKEQGKGTGLGLSTALGIVKSHAGFITVYSEVGERTVFKVYLPAIKTTQIQKAKEHKDLLPAGHGELILVVDDEAQIREITRTMLELHGYRVLAANDGKEAITLYLQHREEIKVILMDMMMPVMDGPSSIRELRIVNPEIKVVAVSGLTENDKIAKIADMHVQALLPKPYTANKLLRTIHGVLSAKERTAVDNIFISYRE